jgi:hypothetical protein
MQPYPGPAPGSFMPIPPSTNQQSDKFLERWWVAIPGRLRRYSVYLSEAWADGIYITIWPKVAVIAPLVLLLLGLLEGASHWTFSDTIQGPGEVPLTFTQLLPFMLLIAAASALSANFGLMLALGYALSDFLIAGFRLTYAQGARFTVLAQLDPGQSFFHLHLAQLISYVLLLLLVVPPTLSCRYLLPRLDRLGLTEGSSKVVSTGFLMIIQGAIVYAWTLSAPLLIRIFWAWTNDQPPLSAAYYLQQQGGWVVAAAVVAVAIREWLSHLAKRNPVVTERIGRQVSALRAADTRPAGSRSLPSYIRAMLAAGVLTLLTSGFLSSILWGVILFLFLSFLLITRTNLLPSLPFWWKWVSLMARVPVVVRLLAGALISYIVSQIVLSIYQNQQNQQSLLIQTTQANDTFMPVLIGVSISLLVMAVLIPPASQLAAAPPPARRPPVPPTYGYGSPPPPSTRSVPLAPAVPPVQPPPIKGSAPPIWQPPPNQPPPAQKGLS